MSIKHKNQKGVALLFAVGLLSLLMVMGLAFVTNSVLIRKSAFNNRSRSQAKMLAQSAISRAMLSIMMYQYSTTNPPADKTAKPWPTDFTGVFSYDKNDGKVYADQIRVKAEEVQAGGSTVNRSYSVLDYPNNSLGYEGHKSPARWVFMYDGDSTVANRKIIGRIAYQVLPPPGGGKKMLNMRHSLSGSRTGSVGAESYTPYIQRWGRGVEELNFDSTSAFNYAGQTWSSVIPATGLIPAFYDELYNAFGTTFFPASRPNTNDLKDWVENWLTEGKVCAYPEVYPYVSNRNRPGVLHRFNISSQGKENWDDRFSSPANSNTRVESIANSGKEFRTTHKNEPNNNVLQFFRRIGSEDDRVASGFSDLEKFRKQIIANFNDYCDSDHIPTSNVNAEKWADDNLWNIPNTISTYNTTLTNEPDYAGNEATPYIYELGFAGKFNTLALTNDRKGLTISMDLTPAVKLVNIYPQLNPIYNSYVQHVWLRQVTLDATVKKVTAKVAYSYTDTNGISQTKNIELDFNSSNIPAFAPLAANSSSWEYDILDADSANHKKTITGESGKNKVTIPFAKTDFTSNNYAHKASTSAFKLTEQTITFAEDKILLPLADFAETSPSGFYSQIKAKVTNDLGVADVDNFMITGISEVSLAEVDLTFTIYPGRMVLMGQYTQTAADGSTSDKLVGVDFFKSLNPSGISAKWQISGTLTATAGVFRNFMLGSLEGTDPRANLHWKTWKRKNRFGTYPTTPDWTLVMKLDEGNSDTPNAAGTNKDKELASEPAWKGNNADQHISTAFIRNAPMKSPWELGLIHRAAPWQTINLKGACSPDNPSVAITLKDHDPGKLWGAAGTTYAGGDGGILDQIKMTDGIYSAGKIDLNALSVSNNEPKTTKELDAELLNMLFVGVTKGQPIAQIINVSGTDYVRIFSDYKNPAATADKPVESAKAEKSGSEAPIKKGDITNNVKGAFLNSRANSNADEYISRGEFLHKHSTAWRELGNNNTDAAEEEIIGKTINLVDASRGALPEVVTVLIVAQTIRDIGGEDGNAVPVVRLNDSGAAISKDCKIGVFDIKTQDDEDYSEAASDKKHLYFDEITGEVKLLATLIRDPLTGKISLRAIEYID